MQGLEFSGVGGLLVLVLPALAALCVLLTAPVARAIGRRQHEEEQVVRAPLLVAGIATLIEAALALAVFRHTSAEGTPLPVGPLYFELTPYALSSVFALTAVVLVLLIATELSQARAGVLGTDQLAGLLFAWGAQCFLALAGGLPTALMGLWLACASVSVLLILEAFRHARGGRLWLLAWAVAVPIGTFLLLLPFHGLPLGSDMLDARAMLRTGGLRTAEGLLLRLWLGVALSAVAGLIAFAAIPRVRVSLSPGPLACAAGALTGALPTAFRVTIGSLPAAALAESQLGPHLRMVWMALGIAALVIALARLSAFRQLCLLCVGCVCGAGWALSFPEAMARPLVLAGPLAGALALPLCFAALYALETAAASPSTAARRLPFAALVLFPALSVLGGPWFALVGSRVPTGAQLAALVLNMLLAAVAVVRVAIPLAAERRECLSRGLFAGSQGAASPGRVIGEAVPPVIWLALSAAAVACWTTAFGDLPRLLP